MAAPMRPMMAFAVLVLLTKIAVATSGNPVRPLSPWRGSAMFPTADLLTGAEAEFANHAANREHFVDLAQYRAHASGQPRSCDPAAAPTCSTTALALKRAQDRCDFIKTEEEADNGDSFITFWTNESTSIHFLKVRTGARRVPVGATFGRRHCQPFDRGDDRASKRTPTGVVPG